MLPLICACINGLINSANAGDLRRHDARVTSLQWCPRISQNDKWCFSIKSRLVAIWISIIKIRLSHNRAIFIMWILYPKRLSLYRNELLVFPHTAYIKWGSLTHWDRVTHVCVTKLTIIGSHNGLKPDRCQAIIWNNAGILLVSPLGTHFRAEYQSKFIYILIQESAFENVVWKTAAILSRPQCVDLKVASATWYCCTNYNRQMFLPACFNCSPSNYNSHHREFICLLVAC